MAKKALVWVWVLACVVGCASRKPGQPTPPAPAHPSAPPPLVKPLPAPVSPLPPPNPAPSVEVPVPQPRPDAKDEAEKKLETSVQRKNFAVWIDGYGLESLAALGFLQELEKTGFKPRKIVGGGFGCWVALSWALENNGNRAEWQAFKWTNWDSVGKNGLLGRLTSRSGHQKFDDEIRRLLPAKGLGDFKIPVDCPVYEKKYPYRLYSGRVLSLESLLWHQFQLPAIGPDPDTPELQYYSAALAGGPLPRELDEMSQDLSGGDGEFGGWIILRTRAPNDRGALQNWVNLLGSRQDQYMASGGFSPSGLSFVVLDLSDGPGRPAAQIKEFDRRRRWLLEGRKRAQLVLRSDEIKKFLAPTAR